MRATMTQFFKFMYQHQLDDIDSMDEHGDTAMHLVIKDEKFTQKEKIEILKNLIDVGIDVHIKNAKSETILNLAITKRMKDMIDFLLTQNIELDYSIAERVIIDEYLKFVGLRYRLVSDSEMRKIEHESADFMEWLISKGLDIDAGGSYDNSALNSALKYNLQHILPTLLKYTTFIDHVENINVGRSFIHIFLWKNKNIRDNHEGKPSKTWYSNYTRRYAVNIVKTMLERGVCTEFIDIDGDTILHAAIELKENVKIVKLLIEHLKDVDQKNFIGKTPFCVALWKWLKERRLMKTNYYLPILRALIDKDVDVSDLDDNKFVLLSTALDRNNLIFIDFLRENDAEEFRVRGRLSLIQLMIEKRLNLLNVKEIEILLKYWIKLDVANLKSIDNGDYELLTKIDEFEQCYMNCLSEIKMLKETVINKQMSMFKWLRRKPTSTRNLFSEELLQIVHSPVLEKQFPEYSVLILASFHRATAQKSLVERAKRLWWDFTEIALPDLCVEAIFSYLSIPELTEFVEKE